MRIRSLAVVVAAALLLCGCSGFPGGPGDPSASTSSASAEARQVAALRAVARCMRSHGYPNFPDPTQQSDGTWNWPSSYNGAFRATTACSQVLMQAKALMGGGKDRVRANAETMAKLRQFARCMRQHGLPDWPDPTEFGSFKPPPRLRPTPGQSKDGVASRWSAQYRACRSLLPPSGLDVEV
jgi:hypothetical protein